ncbi:MAG: tyrosine-type recombinase/integrase, partial [Ornithinimicrobium sp.]
MSSLHEELDTYLDERRALRFQLKTGEYLLRQFLDWLQSRGKRETFTIQEAVQWAREPADAAPVWWSQRLTAVRPFAAWLAARGADVPRIPPGLLPTRTTRRAPFIYSQADLDHLLVACPLFFAHPRVAATMSTIIGLLAATGLRIGEALRLQIPDLDITGNMLHVHATKTPLDRLVPLDPSTTKVLVDYLTLPERLSTDPSPTGPIFVNNRGTGLV